MATNGRERITPRARRGGASTLIVAAAVIGLLAALWYTSRDLELPADARQALPALPEAAPAPAQAGPVVPAAPGVPDAPENPGPQPEEPPLPTLDASDAAVKAELTATAGQGVDPATALATDQLVRRGVVFVRNLAEGKVERKMSPVLAPQGSFQAVRDGDALIAAPASYKRYDRAVAIITGMDPVRVAQLYRRYYPLLQAAYDELGERHPLHPVVVAAIDMLLATPEPAQEPTLAPLKATTYRYTDSRLESLPAAQKQMLRLGAENAVRLKAWLRQLRTELVAGHAEQPAAPQG